VPVVVLGVVAVEPGGASFFARSQPLTPSSTAQSALQEEARFGQSLIAPDDGSQSQ